MSDLTRRPLTTLKHTCGDTAEDLYDVTNFVGQYTVNNAVKNVISVLISCETHDIRYSFNVAPTQDGGTAVGHVLAEDETLELTGTQFISDFQFINKVNGSNAVLQITPEISVR